jgi:hypothetical protein
MPNQVLGALDEAELRRAQQFFRQSAWEIRWLRRDEDALGSLSYRPMHAEFMSAADSFTQAMRHDFAEAWSRQSNSQAPDDQVDSLERRGNNVTSFACASVRTRTHRRCAAGYARADAIAAVQCQE